MDISSGTSVSCICLALIEANISWNWFCFRFRRVCELTVAKRWFDNLVLFFIALNCITLAMERPNIPPNSGERKFLAAANYVFTVVFGVEMFIKVVAAGMFYGQEPYFKSGWNIMDGSLVSVSIVDILMSLISDSSPRIFGILRVCYCILTCKKNWGSWILQ